MIWKNKDDQIRELQEHIKPSRKEVEFEMLQTKAYDTMINIWSR